MMMTKVVCIVGAKFKTMNRQQRRSIERSNLRALKGKRVQVTKKSERLSEIKKKTAVISFVSSIIIGFICSVIIFYIKR